MNKEKKICIFGAGGLGREVLCYLIDINVATDFKIEESVCFMVSDEHYNEKEIMGVEVIPMSKFDPLLFNVVVAIGDPASRKRIVESLPENTTYITIIHPNTTITKWVKIGEGSIVAPGTIITCNIEMGKHTQLNFNTTVGHDCVMGDYFTTAPAANISGSCHFGDCVYFGTNSAVRQGVKICDNVTIGMGAIVIKDISEEGIYIGNPLKKLEKK